MTSTRFFEQREMLRWIKVREHARRAGNPVPTLEEHLAAQHRGLRRLRALDVKRDDATRYCIHRAKLAHRRGRTAERVVYLAAAATLAPKAAIERLRYGYWLR